ncbi:MAG: ABC transporter substrate-binding protein [Eubacteriales bacterium]|nr:ABC transporter substrate-binding protein [Eubacteriales bacterium]
MKKLALIMAAAMMLLTACGQNSTSADKAKEEITEQTVVETKAGNSVAEENVEEKEIDLSSYKLKIGSLKGPTTMGLVNMMDKNENGELPFEAEFTMAVAPDEITAKLVSGDLDIALIPANLASILYNKMKNQENKDELSGISVLNINTLGVIYGVTADESISSLSDLEGKDVYMTGQGTTPEFAFRYILDKNGLTDKVNIIFKNEATEIAAIMNENPEIIAVLPQPFASVCMAKNDNIKEFLNLTEEWKKVSEDGSEMVTGVTVIRNSILEEYPDELIAAFLEEQKDSVETAFSDPDKTAGLIEKYGIIEKAAIAKMALPKCNLSCITGEEMKTALSGYLNVLYNANPKSVGASLPDDDFYYINK